MSAFEFNHVLDSAVAFSTVPFCLSVCVTSKTWQSGGMGLGDKLSLYPAREVLSTQGEGLSCWPDGESRVKGEIG